ncbi:MAG: HlyD family secretion protein [Candidatus Binataceae bacterium]
MAQKDVIAESHIDDERVPLEANTSAPFDFVLLRAEMEALRKELYDRLEREPHAFPTGSEPLDSHIPRGSFQSIHAHPIIFLTILIALILAGSEALRLWAYFQSYQSTDDALIEAHIDPISARIFGTVANVNVDDNQYVRAGTVLATLDPHNYVIAATKARATLAAEQAEVVQTTRSWISAQAAFKAARAAAQNAQTDAARFSELMKHHVVSPQRYDQYMSVAKVSSATAEAARMEEGALESAIAVRRADVRESKAQLAQALLNLSYTKLVAPISGIVGKRSLEVGERVRPGEELLALVPTNRLWVMANFKETQLRQIKTGLRSTVHVDALDRDYVGEVASLAGAANEQYSILPPENATGNYVKVVQRIAVRIYLDPGQPELNRLRPGLSVEATVWLR